MAAAARFINSLPGRYSAGLFGKDPASSSTVFYRCSFLTPFQQSTSSTKGFNFAGLSSAGKAALFYAAQVSNIPAVFMAEPDDLVSLSGLWCP